MLSETKDMRPRRMFAIALCATAIAVSAWAGDEVTAENATFYKDILPILQQNCQECHRPAGTNYGGMVAEQLVSNTPRINWKG